VVAYRPKAKENVKLLAFKVVAVAYKRWSLINGFQIHDVFTGKLLEHVI